MLNKIRKKSLNKNCFFVNSEYKIKHPMIVKSIIKINIFKKYLTGNLDLVSNKAVFRMEYNPWVTPIGDQLQVGVSHVIDYIRSETYK